MSVTHTIQLGSMAVQFLAEGALIERGGELYTVAFVDDCFAYSHDLAEFNLFHVFARNESGRMCKLEIQRNVMIPLWEELTSEESTALLAA